jgi:tetratricopeptide (TPR) repeat protein
MKVKQTITSVGATLFLLIFVLVTVSGQNEKSFSGDKKAFNKALNLIEKGNYHLAIQKLNEIKKVDSANLEVLYYLGYCYLNTSDVPDTAALYFQEGIDKLDPDEAYSDMGIDFRLALAETNQVLLKPDKALKIYMDIKEHMVAADEELKNLIDHKIIVCKNAKIYLNNTVEIKVTNLGKNVNSPYDDHSPLITVKNNQLIFTSRRPTPKAAKLKDGQYPEKIFFSKQKKDKWTKARLLQMFYKKYDHESAASVSADGSELYLFHNDLEGKSIYVSYFNGKSWDKPTKLPYPINTKADETHASLSADKSTLFFTSNREGGYGGMDIYMTKRNAKGEWGKARNLGPNINTELDEDTPILHVDGKTLYFSSEGHNSMGRLDVFYSVMEPDSSWTEPINMGYPINTPDDDFFFVPTINKNEAYYVSSRFEDNYGGADIYNVKFDKGFAGNLSVIEGVIKHDDNTPLEKIRILVTNLDDNRLVGDYRPAPKSGTYLMFLETGHMYEIKQVVSDDQQNVEQQNVKHLNIKIEQLDIKKEMAFSKLNDIVLFKKVTITPPLMPNITMVEKKTKNIERQIAQVTAKSIVIPASLKRPAPVSDSVKTTVPYKYPYAVQILALKKKPLFVYLYFRGLKAGKIKSYRCNDGYTRFIYGVYDGFKAADNARQELQKSGKYQDAFVREYEDIENLTVEPETIYDEEELLKLYMPVIKELNQKRNKSLVSKN